MREIGGDARGVDNIVEGELVNERGQLQKQRQRLRWHKGQQNMPSSSSWGSETAANLSNATRGASNNCSEVVSMIFTAEMAMITARCSWMAYRP